MFEKIKRELMDEARGDTHGMGSMRWTFAADGTGSWPGLHHSEPFQWGLQGITLTIKAPGNPTGLEIPFTNRNQISFPLPYQRTIMVIKPDRSRTR
jgi:hypothetical protein